MRVLIGKGVWLACVLGGCALISKGEPLRPRYFAPEPQLPQAPASAPAASGQALSLGSVRAASHLRERIAYRLSAHELGYYEARRWTDRPEEFLKRALARRLFQDGGMSRARSRSAPVLELELLAFEEVREPRHLARVRILYLLQNGRDSSVERTVTVERPIEAADDSAIAMVTALGDALAVAVDRVATQVEAALRPSTPPVEAQAASGAPCPGACQPDTTSQR